ncbi:MAG: hypothetical protein Q9M28_05730 [Mariprofundaceae bacterium]|nr:hypothetical protein [Mariprofundaceae bacterium]
MQLVQCYIGYIGRIRMRKCTFKVTIHSTNGLCMPCFKEANNGRTPSNLKYIKNHRLEAIEHQWQFFYNKEFPKDFEGVEVAGCLSSALCISKQKSTVFQRCFFYETTVYYQ